MLHAAFVRSPHPHARVKRVDASAVPEGCIALVPGDVADLGLYGCQARDQRVLADVARYAGDVVAAVAAPTRALARAATGLVHVEYEELPAVFDPVEAVTSGARLLHPDAVASADEGVSIGVRPLPGTNVCHRFRLVSGDVAAAFADADVVVEEAFRTPSAAHVPMEPHAAVAEWEDGRLTVWAGTQTPFNTRADLADLFGVDDAEVRIVAPPMGGSFGAKTFVRTEALVAALARKAGRPVKVVLDRAEEFVTLNRHPATIRVRLGARRDGTLRSEEHTSELQSPVHLVCRLLLEKKKTHRTGDRRCPPHRAGGAHPLARRARRGSRAAERAASPAAAPRDTGRPDATHQRPRGGPS